jgi:hypothetical protein
MAERRTIENWGAHLNVEGEPLTMEEAMLLNLGHLNARFSLMIEHLEDMRMRLTRIELYLSENVPGYDAQTQRAARALAEASNGRT